MVQLPVTGRIGPTARRSPALLSNRIPLRLAFRPQDDPHAIVRQLAGELLLGLRHQRYRVENLLADSQGRIPFQGPKVNIWVTGYGIDLGGRPLLDRSLNIGPVNDLSLIVYPEPERLGLRVHLDGNPDLYTADNLGGHAAGLMNLLASWTSPIEDELPITHNGHRQGSVR